MELLTKARVLGRVLTWRGEGAMIQFAHKLQVNEAV